MERPAIFGSARSVDLADWPQGGSKNPSQWSNKLAIGKFVTPGCDTDPMTETDAEFSPFDSGVDDPVELVWPASLHRDPRPLLAYLDLNHWIGSAKAANDHPDAGDYQATLEACRDAKRSGAVIFPLSGTHYMEIAKMADPIRRANLAAIMEELSGFATLSSRFVVMKLELESGLDRLLGPSPYRQGPIRLVGRGVGHSVGVVGGFRIVDGGGNDITDHARSQWEEGALDAFFSHANLEFERTVLCGPKDDSEAAKLRASGWQPDAALKVAQDRADQEAALAVILDSDPRWRKGRLRDVVSANEISRELIEPIVDGFSARDANIRDVFEDRQASRRFIRSMPSIEVAIEMKTMRHRNRETTWDSNTMFDIDAMALAVPYCDAVVTEKHAHATLTRAMFGDRMDTVVMRRPTDLTSWLIARS